MTDYMVKKTSSEGNCIYCSKSYSGITMTRHLESCEKRKNFYLETNKKIKTTKSDDDNKNIVFLLSISSKYYPEYWMFLEVDGRSKLKAIDNFLRDTWLECCGHLSMFTIKGQRYESQLAPISDPFFNENSKTLSHTTSTIFQPGMNIDYVYDYGSSTELVMKVISDIPGKIVEKGKIKLVARNNELVFKCASCYNESATKICPNCIYKKNRNKASFCDSCIKHHECGEEMALPIINSPRSGECGYEG